MDLEKFTWKCISKSRERERRIVSPFCSFNCSLDVSPSLSLSVSSTAVCALYCTGSRSCFISRVVRVRRGRFVCLWRAFVVLLLGSLLFLMPGKRPFFSFFSFALHRDLIDLLSTHPPTNPTLPTLPSLAMFRRSSLFRAGVISSAPIVKELKEALVASNSITMKQAKELKAKFGNEKLSESTVTTAYSGMRGVVSVVYEPSLLDPEEGIRFRGLSIPECQAKLPTAPNGHEMLPEGMIWLLLTGQVPTKQQVQALSAHLHERSDKAAIAAAQKAIQALPRGAHPMTSFSVGVMALQTFSKFQKAYGKEANRSNYWEYALEDMLDCVARTPQLCAMIYQGLRTGKAEIAVPSDPKLDWAANFTQMMGFQSEEFKECMRLYLAIHVDHEGANVSAHTTTLVASALSDPYLSLSAGLNGLAGPLHGLANQEVLGWLNGMMEKCKKENVNLRDEKTLNAAIEKFTWEVLNSGNVVPGYGHAVLRKTDPRYDCQRAFCLRNFPDDDLFHLVNAVYKVMPAILTKHGKTKNPYPNVDAHSGVLLQHYGLLEHDYYTVLFGLSRQIGVLSGIVLDRIQGRPIERPKSITTEALVKRFMK